jgi:streptomycin 6-kinase
MTLIPNNFRQTIYEGYGERGKAWINNLPNLIAEFEQRWQIKAGPPFELSYNYVVPATRSNGEAVVLKLGVPNPELNSEIEALRLYDGHGMARLLEADAERGVLLIERHQPGMQLIELEDDDEATRILAQVMKKLWRPLPANHSFRNISDWAEGMQRLRTHFNGGTGPLPTPIVEMAEQLFTELLASQAEQVLLHGDLHHMNVLSATREPWLAIDPKGIVGEPCYEVGAMLHNRLETDNLKQLLARRVDILSEELGFDRQRIIGWGIAQNVLSAWWTIEDHGEGEEHVEAWRETITVAETLATIK